MKRTTLTVFVPLIVWLVVSVSLHASGQEELVRVDPPSVNVRPGFIGTEVLGDVVNESGFLIGRVRVAITLRDATGKVLDTGAAYVNGINVEIGGRSDDSGIEPGGRAAFSTTLTSAELDNVDTTVFTITFGVADPRSDFDQTPLHLRMTTLESTVQSLETKVRVLEEEEDGRPTTSGLLGDLDNDGDVDFSDFLVFALNFGESLS